MQSIKLRVMNVAYGKIESRIDSVLQKYSIKMLNNQLITNDYLKGLMKDIENILEKEKKCKLIDVALKNEIGLDYLKQIVFEHFADDFKDGLSFDIETSFLFSKNYLKFAKSRVML